MEEETSPEKPQSIIDSEVPIDDNPPPKDLLSESTYMYFSTGHLFNDLGGALYFNYLFFFLKRVVVTPAASAVFLSGQVADGAITPLLGYLCDRFGSKKYGQRTPWYFSGLLIFIVGYSTLYLNANRIFGQELSQGWQYSYYITSNLLTNLGWACVQIANMSLIPTITYSRANRSRLSNLRNNRTFMCSLAVLGTGTILFSLQQDATLIILQMMIAFGVIGVSFCVVYLVKIQQVPLSNGAKQCRERIRQWLKKRGHNPTKNNKLEGFLNTSSDDQEVTDQPIQLQQEQQSQIAMLLKWLKHWPFYLFALFFLSSRIYINVSGTFMPFLIVDILEFSQEGAVMPVYITINSLIVTVFQILATILLPRVSKHYDILFIYTVAALVAFVLGCFMLLLGPQVRYLVFVFAILIGTMQAVLLNVSYDLMYEVIGDKVRSSGMVIGIYGLLDKCSSGLIVYFITSAELFDSSLAFKQFAVCVVPVSFLGLSGLIAIFKVIKEKKYVRKVSPRERHFKKIKKDNTVMFENDEIETYNSDFHQKNPNNPLINHSLDQKVLQLKDDMIF